MDLNYGEKYENFRKEVQEFCKEWKGVNFKDSSKAPLAQDYEATGITISRSEWQSILIKKGYFARSVPKDYGGFGGESDIIKSRIIASEFSNAKIPAAMGGQGIDMLVPTLLELGTEEQKKQYIKPTLHGEIIWCQGYSEPNAGSDLASLQTKGELVNGNWVINGQKIWTSTAQYSQMMFCLVRTEPDAQKHAGISYLLIPMDTPGIEIRPLVDMTLKPGFNEVFFTDVTIAGMIQKLVGTELRHELEGFAIDIMGEIGTLYEDSPHLRDSGSWQFLYMYYLGLIIGGGTSQIQKNIISERGLGMPREPKVQGV